MNTKPFWKNKQLDEFSEEEWEMLCDGCARCCLIKLEDVDTGALAHTKVACELLDQGTCQCTSYADRHQKVPTCIKVSPQNAGQLEWIPPTCAYRKIAEGKDLEWWHPLVCGEHESIVVAGISVKGRVISEKGLSEDDLEDYIEDWPGEDAAS
jgi:uncharacterized protein